MTNLSVGLECLHCGRLFFQEPLLKGHHTKEHFNKPTSDTRYCRFKPLKESCYKVVDLSHATEGAATANRQVASGGAASSRVANGGVAKPPRASNKRPPQKRREPKFVHLCTCIVRNPDEICGKTFRKSNNHTVHHAKEHSGCKKSAASCRDTILNPKYPENQNTTTGAGSSASHAAQQNQPK